ncbi:TPA: hypothetical protein ACXYLK_003343 [Legionella pneumophila]|uniref:hypothetical protein n=1 Tax=Legionella anisa TaxID=28082 RepID=UPI00037DBE37|nr:hypothetical protein [Legionella anisa]MCW8449542.1 hypothetical protein [Legionella anisa]
MDNEHNLVKHVDDALYQEKKPNEAKYELQDKKEDMIQKGIFRSNMHHGTRSG